MNDYDIIIVGAGISGIGMAHHLKRKCPGKTFAILESRQAIGGTWDLFRYPGVRSDSDMHTLGYVFKPWLQAKAIADGPSIRDYVIETAEESGITGHIQFGHEVLGAAWLSDSAQWLVDVKQSDDSSQRTLRCNFLLMCSGYYNYTQAYSPQFPGTDEFEGPIIHPQFWPENLDYAGKRVVVIGSGATAMTLVPAMADNGARITMVQRSPTYVVSQPSEDAIANFLRKVLPEKFAYAITRWKNIYRDLYFYHRTRVAPEKVKQQLLGLVRKSLGPDYDVDTHFNPRYDPWDQRLCLIPDDDLYKAIVAGNASVVTDNVVCITKRGVKVGSGDEIPADIIVTATGLKLAVMGGVQFTVDGETVNFADTYTYKGMMFSDVPNLLQTFGYINASWTLRVDLNADYVCRLLNLMQTNGVARATPRIKEHDKPANPRPWIDDFSAGYIQRLLHLFPKQGNAWPWVNSQNYSRDRKGIARAPIEDGALELSNVRSGLKSSVRAADAA